MDKAKLIFEKAMKPKMLEKITNDSQFQTKIISFLDEHQLKSDVNQNLEDFFHRIENYTSMITSNPKQIMLDEEKHLADYVKRSYLTPIGSFALGCMRNRKLVIDAILSYEEAKFMDEKQLLGLYSYSLQTCYTLDQEAGTNIEHMKFSFSIERADNEQEFLQIKSIGSSNFLTLNIFILKQYSDGFMKGRNLPIQHVYNIYSYLNGSLEELRLFQKLLRAMRKWREEFDLMAVNIEILDIILLAAFLSNQSTNLEKTFATWGYILNSASLTLKFLKNFDPQYLALYGRLLDNDDLGLKLLNVSKKFCQICFSNECQDEWINF